MKQIVPLLQVSNLADTIGYYEEALGFSLVFRWPEEGEPRWVGMSRGDIAIMFTIDLGTSSAPFIAEKGNGVVLYVLVNEVAPLFDELVARGAIIVQEVHDFGGRHQFSIADPNGYILAFSEAFA
ncbi:MAG TPA: hypothetical protein GX714_09895 [Chloroflexi bacterium]|jgi:uncharacterized glyoxalase superfamily protein PhnB|nr:hypothetical protein [Chloroflexota bacterium]